MNGNVIYDTQPGAADNAIPTTPLNGGSVKVHTQNSCVARPMEWTNDINIYPNPASDLIYYDITSDDNRDMVISLFDVMGRLIYRQEQKVQQGMNTGVINVVNFQRGAYFFEIRSNSYTTREKIVLQ